MRIIPYTKEHETALRKVVEKDSFFDEHYEKCLATEHDEILGWVAFEQHADRLLIDWVRVREEHQRKGVGLALIQHVCALARERGLRGVSVNTGSRTSWARRLYEKAGFKEVGRVKEYFSFDPEHVFYWYRTA